MRCPILGRYSVVSSLADRRRRRQQITIGDQDGEESRAAECVSGDYHSASLGCVAAQDTIEFRSSCSSTVYTCHGSWREGPRVYLVAAPLHPAHGHHPRALCFIYTTHRANDTRGGSTEHLLVSAATHSCDRALQPGVGGDKAYNLTLNGTCEQSSKHSGSTQVVLAAFLPLLTAAVLRR